MVGGYDISLVAPDGTPPERIREYFELIREKERAVDEEWGGRPLSERPHMEVPREPTEGTKRMTQWLDKTLVKALDEDRVDALFEPTDEHDPIIYDSEDIATLLDLFRDAKEEFVESSRKQRPELYFEGKYIAMLEFAVEHEEFGVSIPI